MYGHARSGNLVYTRENVIGAVERSDYGAARQCSADHLVLGSGNRAGGVHRSVGAAAIVTEDGEQACASTCFRPSATLTRTSWRTHSCVPRRDFLDASSHLNSPKLGNRLFDR